MKKIFFVAICFSFTKFVSSQTRAETENWLKNTLQEYFNQQDVIYSNTGDQVSPSDSIYKYTLYRFEGNKLVCKTVKTKEMSNGNSIIISLREDYLDLKSVSSIEVDSTINTYGLIYYSYKIHIKLHPSMDWKNKPLKSYDRINNKEIEPEVQSLLFTIASAVPKTGSNNILGRTAKAIKHLVTLCGAKLNVVNNTF